MAISFSDHDPAWGAAFADEARNIRRALRGAATITLHHIGSTSVPGLCAKPIIDLMGEVSDLRALLPAGTVFGDLGYEVMGAFGIEGRLYYRKIDASGERTHHLHIYESGSAHVARHLAFRDYLRTHPRVAQAYGDLKRDLARRPAMTWEGYMDGKDSFIARVERVAVAWYTAGHGVSKAQFQKS